MTKRIAALFAALVLAFGVGVSPASPAQAAYNDCANYPGTFCLFANANYTNPIWRQYPYQVTGCRQLSGSWNDVVTSAWNNTQGHHTLRLWKNYPCGGSGNAYIDVPSGMVTHFAAGSWNDIASAIEDIEW